MKMYSSASMYSYKYPQQRLTVHSALRQRSTHNTVITTHTISQRQI